MGLSEIVNIKLEKNKKNICVFGKRSGRKELYRNKFLKKLLLSAGTPVNIGGNNGNVRDERAKMRRYICNECGGSIGAFARRYLFTGKIVCRTCIDKLVPDGRRPDPVKDERDASKDLVFTPLTEQQRYDRARRRVMFFLSGCVTAFWFAVVAIVVAAAMGILFVKGW
jgi:hypothetical protein